MSDRSLWVRCPFCGEDVWVKDMAAGYEPAVCNCGRVSIGAQMVAGSDEAAARRESDEPVVVPAKEGL